MGIDDIIIGRTKFDRIIRDDRAYIKVHNENHAPTIFVDDETIYIVWFAGTVMGDGDIAIYLSKLDLGSEVWTEPKCISKIGGYSCQNPVIFKDKEVLIVLHTAQSGRKHSLPYTQENALIFRIESADKGESWSSPSLVLKQSGFFIRARPLSVENKWYLPIYATPWNLWDHYSAICELNTMNTINKIKGSEGLVQPCLVRVEDELHLYFRDRHCENIFVSKSDLTQQTWSDPVKTNLPNNDSGVCFEYLGDGMIVAVLNPTNSEARYPLSLYVSKDRGTSWSFCKNLHDDVADKKYMFAGYGPEMSYPSIMVDKNRVLHIAYSFCRGGICYVRLTITDINSSIGTV